MSKKKSLPAERPLGNKPVTGHPGKKLVSIPLLLAMTYLFIPLILTGFEVLDANGPQFLGISILNLFTFLYLIFKENSVDNQLHLRRFICTPLALLPALLLLFHLISLIGALNVNEAFMNMARVFTVTVAVYLLAVIFTSSPEIIKKLAVVMACYLIFDSLMVFYNVGLFISGEIKSIMDIRLLYDHKNVIAASLFVKLPAAIWLIFFHSGWRKILGYVSGLLAMVAIFSLSTRAFYLGLVLMFLILLAVAVIRWVKFSEKNLIRMMAGWGVAFILAALLYSAAQWMIFPKDRDLIWNASLVNRISTITTTESSANARINSWRWSWKLIKQNPIIGTGSGNWKIEVRKYENRVATEFNYAVKAHNDFIETTAETGIPGGLTFISIFFLILLTFIRLQFTSPPGDKLQMLFFLPAIGLMAYSVDAFFNFPADRPVMQVLFAIYLGMAIAIYPERKKKEAGTPAATAPENLRLSNRRMLRIVSVLIIILMSAAIWLLYNNTVSLFYQLEARRDNLRNSMSKPSSYFISGFPSIPDLTCLGEPIAVNKARYLIGEEKFREAVTILKNDRTSPYDSRCDYYLSFAYDKLGNADSAIYFGRQAWMKQPNHGNMVKVLSPKLFLLGGKQEAMEILQKYCMKNPDDGEAILMLARQYLGAGDTIKARNLLFRTRSILMKNDTLARESNKINQMIISAPFRGRFEEAKLAYQAKKYAEARTILDEISKARPGFGEIYEIRAFCNFYLKDYKTSMLDIHRSFTLLMEERPELINLRGIIFLKTGKSWRACSDFKKAMDQGLSSASMNYSKYCLKK